MKSKLRRIKVVCQYSPLKCTPSRSLYQSGLLTGPFLACLKLAYLGSVEKAVDQNLQGQSLIDFTLESFWQPLFTVKKRLD